MQPAPVMFSANNTNAAKNTTATFSKVGTYQLAVTIIDPEGAATNATLIANVLPTLTTIYVTSANASVKQGQTLQFSAVASDQFGDALATQPNFVWSTDSDAGTVDSSGLYSASASTPGSATITATSGNVTGNATIAVKIPITHHAVVPDTTPPASVVSPAPSIAPAASLITDNAITLSNISADDSGAAPLATIDAQADAIIAPPPIESAAPVGALPPAKVPTAAVKTDAAEKPPAAQNAPAPPPKDNSAADASAATSDVTVATVPEQVFSFLAPQSAGWKQMDTAKDQMTSEVKLKIAAGTATATSVGVSAAYLIWLVRGGSLLSSLLSLFPAWKTMDPLPVLESYENSRKSRKRRSETDKESLESLVDDADKPLGTIGPDPASGTTRKAA